MNGVLSKNLGIYNRCDEWLGEWEVQLRECLNVC